MRHDWRSCSIDRMHKKKSDLLSDLSVSVRMKTAQCGDNCTCLSKCTNRQRDTDGNSGRPSAGTCWGQVADRSAYPGQQRYQHWWMCILYEHRLLNEYVRMAYDPTENILFWLNHEIYGSLDHMHWKLRNVGMFVSWNLLTSWVTVRFKKHRVSWSQSMFKC
jgi:hypothetical protein